MRYAWFGLACVALACAVFFAAFRVDRVCTRTGFTKPTSVTQGGRVTTFPPVAVCTRSKHVVALR